MAPASRVRLPSAIALVWLLGPLVAFGAPRQAASSRPPTSNVSFEEAARRAAAARDADEREALRWYREAVRLRPSWDEGWWYLGALSYARGEDAEALRAFSRFVELKPDSGPAWGLRGLSEFRLENYDVALHDLTRGLSLGSVGNAEIRNAVYYALALLRIRSAEFELAVEPLAGLAKSGCGDARVVTACGLLLLRLAHLPEAIPPDKREIVQATGDASCAALGLHEDAGPKFEALLKRYPTTRYLHYGYGAYLLHKDEGSAAAAGLAELQKEIEVDPGSVYARLEIAYELIRDGRHAEALPYAQQAVKLAPGLFASHNALGRALYETGQVNEGIAELEEAVRLAPASLEVRAALAGAYGRAGRVAEAERERDVLRNMERNRSLAPHSTLMREDSSSRPEARP